MKLSVLVPVYNEERTLEEVVRRVCDFQIPKEIILVDDGSEDQSRKILTRLQEENARAKDPLNQIKVFFQPVNQGKGAALKTALSHVTGDIVIVQDADLEYDPKDYPSLLAPIRRDRRMSFTAHVLPAAGPTACIFFGTRWATEC